MGFLDAFKRDKPRLYLDSIFIVPRGEFERMDEWGLFTNKENFAGSIREGLDEVFSLPHVSTVENPGKNDFGLQIAVAKFQGGELGMVNLSPLASFPIGWRPKVEVRARLYYLKSKKTKAQFKVTEKASWSKYLGRAVTVNGVLFRYKPLFSRDDILFLLFTACKKIMQKVSVSL